MQNIDINRDLMDDEYDVGIFKGFKGREILFMALAVIVGGGGILLLSQYIPLLLAVYMGAPLSLGIGYMGFYNKHGMIFTEMVKKKRKAAKERKVYKYSSKEMREELYRYIDKTGETR